MSQETREWLSTNVLVGMTSERGNAWHYREGDQNHYEGPIPAGDVVRRLFDWEAVKVPVLAQLPSDKDNFNALDDDGGYRRNVRIPNMVAIARSDNGFIFPRAFSEGFEPHQLADTLIGATSNILGDSLVITSAGLLRQGAVGWVEVSVPETLHDSLTGFSYRPNLLATTSFDGSLASTWGKTITATVCDNTHSAALGEMGEQKVKVRHSKHSKLAIESAREALSLITQLDEGYLAALHHQAATTVTDKQWFAFLDAWSPLPDEKGSALTRSENRRDEIQDLYRRDPRVAPWSGTAFGVVQAVNTWTHHFQEVRGSTRQERNMERTVSGKVDALDADTLGKLNLVLSAV